mmetsp:Transcript_25565/g.78891  ORF Transcript_25565/g.78891 Transcript_25565/m.78891 type:complete len:215 (+) Transcript_25565:35-679(+)
MRITASTNDGKLSDSSRTGRDSKRWRSGSRAASTSRWVKCRSRTCASLNRAIKRCDDMRFSVAFLAPGARASGSRLSRDMLPSVSTCGVAGRRVPESVPRLGVVVLANGDAASMSVPSDDIPIVTVDPGEKKSLGERDRASLNWVSHRFITSKALRAAAVARETTASVIAVAIIALRSIAFAPRGTLMSVGLRYLAKSGGGNSTDSAGRSTSCM